MLEYKSYGFVQVCPLPQQKESHNYSQISKIILIAKGSTLKHQMLNQSSNHHFNTLMNQKTYQLICHLFQLHHISNILSS